MEEGGENPNEETFNVPRKLKVTTPKPNLGRGDILVATKNLA